MFPSTILLAINLHYQSEAVMVKAGSRSTTLSQLGQTCIHPSIHRSFFQSTWLEGLARAPGRTSLRELSFGWATRGLGLTPRKGTGVCVLAGTLDFPATGWLAWCGCGRGSPIARSLLCICGPSDLDCASNASSAAQILCRMPLLNAGWLLFGR